MDDLVAELTLKFRDEMSGGLDEIKGEFGGLNATLAGIRDVLGELNTTLAELRAPTDLNVGLEAVTASADEATTAIGGIGTAIDGDIAKMRQLGAEMQSCSAWIEEYQSYNAGSGGGGGYYGGGSGGEPAPAPGEPVPVPEPGEPRPRNGGAGGMHGDVAMHLFMAGAGVAVAKESADEYADYEQILYQTAIKEGFSPKTAGARVAQLEPMLDSLALKTANSSTALAEAYYWLTTTGMNPNLIDQMMPALARDATAYGNVPMEDAQSVYTLNGVLNVPASQMSTGLSVISEAAQLGHFGVGDFGTYLPGLGAQLNILKDTGIGGLVQVASALEATRRVSGSSEQDAIDMQDLIMYLASPTASRF